MVSFTPDAERREAPVSAPGLFFTGQKIRVNSGRTLHQETLDHPVNCQNISNFQIKIPRVTNANTQTNETTREKEAGS